MTNTLTWDIKSIQVPKVNSNLLSVVSLILLLTMTFLTASVIAYHCGDIQENLAKAVVAEGIAIAAAKIAEQALKAAMSSGNPWAIAAAAAGLTLALAAVAAAGAAIGYYTAQLVECEAEHENAGSGSCGSG